MDDQEFLERIQEKIERMSGRPVELVLDQDDPLRVAVDLGSPLPRVFLGRNILVYPGLARMGIEYAVASIRAGRHISPLEFTLLLRRN